MASVLMWHGYLLGGTGSNVYNAQLARALRSLGHEVHMICQERHCRELDWVDAIGDWDNGTLEIEVLREPVRLTVYRPNIGRLLPVYVADDYEEMDAKVMGECSEEELEHYMSANVDAAVDVVNIASLDSALANHLVFGPTILARAGLPCAVKIHGSALEFVVSPDTERFAPYAKEGLDNARTILVGSLHTATRLWEVMGEEYAEKTYLGPPGVDIHQFKPSEHTAAVIQFEAVKEKLLHSTPSTSTGSFAKDEAGAAEALSSIDLNHPLALFVGKLIANKGVELAIAAWPLVLARVPTAQLLVVGFGAFTQTLRELQAVLAVGDIARARRIAVLGRAGEGGVAESLPELHAFLQSNIVTGIDYRVAAATLPERIVWTGRLDHSELIDIMPACSLQLVTSTFPEAFGMVAAEAAACGVFPICANHSGLAEVTAIVRNNIPEESAAWLNFDVGEHSVSQLADNIISWLEAPADVQRATRNALVQTAQERFSWEGVANGVLEASRGQTEHLERP